MLPKDIVDQRIAIVGAGVAGSFLFRMLKRMGATSVDLFSKKEKTACGIHSCAWMTRAEIRDLLRPTEIETDQYIIGRHKRIKIIDRIKETDIIVLDKPRLIKDLIAGEPLRYDKPDTSQYDRVIDATGAARALLPPAHRLMASTAQFRVKADRPDLIEIQYIPRGYTWSVPIGRNLFHIGCGCGYPHPEQFLERTFGISLNDTICSCQSEINLTPPDHNLPFIKENIWGVGEAIGCVSPLIGEGILPVIESATILLKNWNDPEAYTSAILRNFRRISIEYKTFRGVEKSSFIALLRYPVIKKCFDRYNININVVDALKILKQIKK